MLLLHPNDAPRFKTWLDKQREERAILADSLILGFPVEVREHGGYLVPTNYQFGDSCFPVRKVADALNVPPAIRVSVEGGEVLWEAPG